MHRHLWCAALLGCGAFGLQAQDFAFGGQVTYAKPQGDIGGSDWLDGKAAVGGGLNLLLGWQGGHALVPRIDFVAFKRTESIGELKVETVKLGADYQFYFQGKAGEGPYVSGGLGFTETKFVFTLQGFGSDDTKKNSAYFGLGFGWMFNRHVGLELKYDHTSISESGTNYTFPTINLSLVGRF